MSVREAFELTGKVAVVTGGASGIGKATAEVFAEAGASVVVADLDGGGAEKTVAGIAESGGKATARAVNVARKDEVEALVDQAVDAYGRLDVIANIAGIAVDGPFIEASEDDLDRVLAVNLKGVFFGCQAAARVMIPQGSGCIINVSSTAIDTPAPRYALYGMAKAGVAQLTKTIAFELGRYGIRANTIAPGMTVSGLTARHVYEPDGSINQERYDEFVERMSRLSPLKMVGDPIDQAYLMLYLASDAARWCTGQIWRVNGGQAMP